MAHSGIPGTSGAPCYFVRHEATHFLELLAHRPNSAIRDLGRIRPVPESFESSPVLHEVRRQRRGTLRLVWVPGWGAAMRASTGGETIQADDISKCAM